MLSVERHQQILEQILNKRSVRVNELSDKLDVSVATIRRDLSQMEEKGLIQRVHGGAIPIEDLRRASHLATQKQAGRSQAPYRNGRC